MIDLFKVNLPRGKQRAIRANVFSGSVATQLRWGGKLCTCLEGRNIRIRCYQQLRRSTEAALIYRTRSSADADNRLDAFSGQSRSTNMVPFHMLHMVSYCAIVTLSLRHAAFTIFVFKKFRDLEMGVKGHSRSLRVVSFDRLCMVSY